MKPTILMLALAAICLPVAAAKTTPDFTAAFNKLPKSVHVYHYKLSESVMQAQLAAAMQKAMHEGLAAQKQAKAEGEHGKVTKVSNIFVLPQLYIYDPHGREVLHHTGGQKNLDALLGQVFSHHRKTVPDSKPLSERLKGAVPAQTGGLAAPIHSKRYTLVEYWAQWCESCFAERDALMAYVHKHPQLHLDWITVDADFVSAFKNMTAKKP